jgi:hypothetical protein
MMRSIVVTLLILAIAASISAQELAVYTEEPPPLNRWDQKEQRVAGFSVEIVEALFKETGIRTTNDEIKVYPWARA